MKTFNKFINYTY